MSEHPHSNDETRGEVKPLHLLDRRRFLIGSGAAAAATGIAVTPGAAQDATPEAPAAATPMGEHVMPLDPGDSPIAFFTLHEAQTVDALAGRILPGSADDPGAREAGAVYYIDRTLSGVNFGYGLKTYTQGPFLGTNEEPITVEASSVPDIYRTVWVAETNVPRFGYQSILTPQQMYRRGLSFVDAYAQAQFGADFIELTDQQMDSIVTDLESDAATGFDGPSARGFFTQLRNDTIEGTFSDPMYGGNRDKVGWKLIGFPGAQRIYSADEMKTPGTTREPQGMMELMESEAN